MRDKGRYASQPLPFALQPSNEIRRINPQRFGKLQELNYVQPSFAPLDLGHIRLLPANSVGKFYLSDARARARFH